MFKSIIESEKIDFSYIYSSTEIENLHLYFKMKNKNGFEFNNDEADIFIKSICDKIGYYDVVFFPQTSGCILPMIAKKCGLKAIMLNKKTKKDIKLELLSQKMMKSEKSSLLRSIDEMKDDFKINQIKGNQRNRFSNILFEKIKYDFKDDDKILLIDDSIFSGETFSAMKRILNVKSKNIVIFSKF